jgi:hypothetical protein
MKKILKYTVLPLACFNLISCAQQHGSSHAGAWQGMHNLELVTLKLYDSGKAEFQNTTQTLTGTWSQYDGSKSYLNIHGRGTLTTTEPSKGMLTYNNRHVWVKRMSYGLSEQAPPKKTEAVKSEPKPQAKPVPAEQSYHLNRIP